MLFRSILSKSLPAAHASAVTWRLSVCVSWPFMWAFFWSFAPIRNWASYDDRLYISCAYHFVFLCCLPCWLIVPAVMTQSCWAPFWADRLFLFLVAYHRHCFVSFCSWAPMSLCFLLLGIHGPFANSLGLPRPVC